MGARAVFPAPPSDPRPASPCAQRRRYGADGPPLGVLDGASCAGQHSRLAHGETLLLFTDGLVEVPGEGVQCLLEHAEGVAAPPIPGTATALIRHLAEDGEGGRALLIVHRNNVSGLRYVRGMTSADGETKKGQPILLFAADTHWEAWLAEHHADSGGVWLKFAKKGSGITSLQHREALDTALCYGWIDGQGSVYDAEYWLVRFSPRTPKSRWSRVNQGKVAVLAAAGRMRAPGQAAIEAAQADGRWDAAYESQSASTVPPDLQLALDASPEAAAVFATLTKGNRFAILHQVSGAKRPETRASRIARFVAKLAEGQRVFG